jgi:hypothetical protein
VEVHYDKTVLIHHDRLGILCAGRVAAPVHKRSARIRLRRRSCVRPNKSHFPDSYSSLRRERCRGVCHYIAVRRRNQTEVHVCNGKICGQGA